VARDRSEAGRGERGERRDRSDSGDRPRPTGGRRPPPGQLEDRVLALRETGASFSAIARRLEMKRATDANEAFFRALERREGDEQRELVRRELERLDLLEARIRERDAGKQEKIDRRLEAVSRLRSRLP
jgi:hypothetical protein